MTTRTTDSTPELRTGVFLLFLAIVVTVYTYIFRNNINGDTLIHLIYGRNIAHGRFMQFNDGEVSSGSSSIIWTMMSALPYLLQSDDFRAMYIQKAMSLIVLVASLLWLRRASFFRLSPTEYIIVAAFWLGLSKFIQFSTVGMETPLAIFLMLLLVNNTYLLLRDIRILLLGTDGDGSPPGTPARPVAHAMVGGIYAGLLVLTRLELSLAAMAMIGFLTVAIVYWRPAVPAAEAGAHPRGARVALGLGALYGVMMAITILPYFAFIYRVTGSLISNSALSRLYLAQHHVGSAIHVGGPFYLNPKLVAFLIANSPLIIAAALAVRLGLVAAGAAAKLPSLASRRWGAYPVAIAFCVLLVAGLSLYYLVIFPGFRGARYFMPVFALIVIWAARGVMPLSRWIGSRTPLSPRTAAIGFVVFVLLAHGVFNQTFTPIDNIPPDLVSISNMGNFISKNVPAGKSILVYEVQVKLHLPHHRVLAEDGVTDGMILKYYKNDPDPVRAIERFFLEVRPDYVISGIDREKLTPRITRSVLAKLQRGAISTVPGQTVWLTDRIGATEVYQDPRLPQPSEPHTVEKLYQMTFR